MTTQESMSSAHAIFTDIYLFADLAQRNDAWAESGPAVQQWAITQILAMAERGLGATDRRRSEEPGPDILRPPQAEDAQHTAVLALSAEFMAE